MLRHVVTFTWNPGTTDAQVQALVEGLRRLPEEIAEIRHYSFGPDLGLGGNGDFAVVADFDDADAYRVYASHPAHQRVITELVVPIRATRLAVQFEHP